MRLFWKKQQIVIKRIADAQDYFMIMNEHYRHPERIRKQEKKQQKNRSEIPFGKLMERWKL